MFLASAKECGVCAQNFLFEAGANSDDEVFMSDDCQSWIYRQSRTPADVWWINGWSCGFSQRVEL